MKQKTYNSVQNSPRQSANAEAFAEAYLFFSICLNKKNVKAIKFLGMLKKYVSKNKIYFCLKKKKRNNQLNKKVIFVFHTIFKLDFTMQIIYSIIHIFLYSLFILFCSLISVFKFLTLLYSYNWQKFNNKMNKKKPGVSEYGS